MTALPVIVIVTAEDIAHGRRNDCHRCPVARAVRRALGDGAATVAVGCLTCMVWAKGAARPWRAWLPPAVVRFVADFDRGRPVVPFAFSLTPTPKLARRPNP